MTRSTPKSTTAARKLNSIINSAVKLKRNNNQFKKVHSKKSHPKGEHRALSL